MSPSELIKYIEEPKLLNESSIIDITLLAEKYPFFQTIQLLRIKNLHNLDPSTIKQALNFTAAYVSDRKILYYLLHPISQKEQPQAINENVNTEPGNFSVLQHEKEVKDTIRENISDTLTNQKNFLDANQDAEIEFSTTMDVVKEYGEGIELEDFVVRINKSEDTLLELFEDKENPTNEDAKLKDDKSIDTEKEDILTIINKGILPDNINHEHSNLSDSQKKKNFLIDNFIKSNPKIEPVNQSAPDNSDISSDSVKENDHFITDTLANIYLKQGHYAKAIFAYEKLSLKYPEKSAYFAGQIAEIKKLIEKK